MVREGERSEGKSRESAGALRPEPRMSLLPPSCSHVSFCPGTCPYSHRLSISHTLSPTLTLDGGDGERRVTSLANVMIDFVTTSAAEGGGELPMRREGQERRTQMEAKANVLFVGDASST